MVLIKFFGVIVAFYIFVDREAYAQNFYPARYGKKDENDFGGGTLQESRRFGRNDEQGTISDRKIRFFISGGRYGKRGCPTDVYSEGSKEVINSEFDNSQNENEMMSIPIRKSQFMMGSRFGKRFKAPTDKGSTAGKQAWCIFTNSYYKCFSRPHSEEEPQNSDSTLLHSVDA